MLPTQCCLLSSIQPIEFALNEFALNECIFTFNVMCIPSNMKAYLEPVNFFLNSWAKVTEKTNILNSIQIQESLNLFCC